MFSRTRRFAALLVGAGLLLIAPVARAKSIHGTFSDTFTDVTMSGVFSFDGNLATLSTFSGHETFHPNASFGGRFSGQAVAEYATDPSKPCSSSFTFTGPFGESEPKKNSHGKPDPTATLSLVKATGVANYASGSIFHFATSGSGCVDTTDGFFTITESGHIGRGTGSFSGAKGTYKLTVVGLTQAAPASPGYGFFHWGEIKGTDTLQIP